MSRRPRNTMFLMFAVVFCGLWILSVCYEREAQRPSHDLCRTSIAEPIIGPSEPVAPGEFPFLVSISKYWPFIMIEKSFCSGTLISKRHVLTADHCIGETPENDTVVIVGTLNFQNGTMYRVRSYMSYDDWFEKLQRMEPNDSDDDIGILTLSQDISENIRPAPISALSAQNVYGKSVVYAGWGFTDDHYNVRPETLLKAYVKVLTPKEYKVFTKLKYKKPKIPKPELYYTWSEKPVVLGLGDNGGPLLIKRENSSVLEVIGINTAGCLAQDPQLDKYSMSCHLKISFSCYAIFIEEVKNNRHILVPGLANKC